MGTSADAVTNAVTDAVTAATSDDADDNDRVAPSTTSLPPTSPTPSPTTASQTSSTPFPNIAVADASDAVFHDTPTDDGVTDDP